jgi:hypothetical protein
MFSKLGIGNWQLAMSELAIDNAGMLPSHQSKAQKGVILRGLNLLLAAPDRVTQ